MNGKKCVLIQWGLCQHESLRWIAENLGRSPSIISRELACLFVSLAQIDNARAEATVTGIPTVLNRIDAQRRLAPACDQGKEMAYHKQLDRNTGVKSYFADPLSPWQHGFNENTNELLRQYLPKDTEPSSFSQSELDTIAWRLNTRPRNSLGWKCLAKLFIPDDFNMKAHYDSCISLWFGPGRIKGDSEACYEPDVSTVDVI